MIAAGGASTRRLVRPKTAGAGRGAPSPPRAGRSPRSSSRSPSGGSCRRSARPRTEAPTCDPVRALLADRVGEAEHRRVHPAWRERSCRRPSWCGPGGWGTPTRPRSRLRVDDDDGETEERTPSGTIARGPSRRRPRCRPSRGRCSRSWRSGRERERVPGRDRAEVDAARERVDEKSSARPSTARLTWTTRSSAATETPTRRRRCAAQPHDRDDEEDRDRERRRRPGTENQPSLRTRRPRSGQEERRERDRDHEVEHGRPAGDEARPGR